MKKSAILFFAGMFLFFMGCTDKPDEDPSRYACVGIPEYTEADYISFLSDENPEVVYNAVCNLHIYAEDIARILSDEKANRNSRKYLDALNIYNQILTFLKSKDNRILAASLRFWQIFSQSYSKKEDLIIPILNVRSDNTNVQLEQIIALSNVVSKMSPSYEPLLKSALKSRSWLVSRTAYMLINNLAVENIRTELIQQYKTINSESEKLLILTALEENGSMDTFDFLCNEFLTVNNDKIRKVVHKILSNQDNRQQMLKWLDDDYDKLSEENIVFLINHHQDISSLDVLEILIKHGFVPDQDFVTTLFNSVNEFKEKTELSVDEKEEFNKMIHFKEQLVNNEANKIFWDSLEEKKEIEMKLYVEILPKAKALFARFIKESDELLKKHGFSEDKRNGLAEAQKEIEEMTLHELKEIVSSLEKENEQQSDKDSTQK